jgi:hypothetical protein
VIRVLSTTAKLNHGGIAGILLLVR